MPRSLRFEYMYIQYVLVDMYEEDFSIWRGLLPGQIYIIVPIKYVGCLLSGFVRRGTACLCGRQSACSKAEGEG